MKRTPLRRKTRLQSRGKPRFKGYVRNEPFRYFVRSQGCILADQHECEGIIEFCHVIGRGAGGRDEANGYPGCSKAHREQHARGIKSFQQRHGLDLSAIAAELWREFAA